MIKQELTASQMQTFRMMIYNRLDVIYSLWEHDTETRLKELNYLGNLLEVFGLSLRDFTYPC